MALERVVLVHHQAAFSSSWTVGGITSSRSVHVPARTTSGDTSSEVVTLEAVRITHLGTILKA